MQLVDAVLNCGNISEGAHTQTDGTMTTLVLIDMDHNHEKNGGGE